MNNQLIELIERMIPENARGFGRRKRVSEILSSCPSTGNGVHRWLFNAALKLHRHIPDKGLLARLVTEAMANCGREVSEQEIDDAIANSQRIAEGKNPEVVRRPRWPRPNEEKIAGITKAGQSLIAISPVRWSDAKSHSEEIIDALFPGNPLLCAAMTKERSITRTREEWRGFLANQQFLVPNPMSAIWGTTKIGHQSMRCLSNTGARRYLVIEFDQGDFTQHAALLVHLGKFVPLVLVVHSGNKSLHGWYYCAGEPEEKVQKFFSFAVSLGADPATWTRCQLVRAPQGLRENGNRQSVLYFNPKTLDLL